MVKTSLVHADAALRARTANRYGPGRYGGPRYGGPLYRRRRGRSRRR